MSRSAVRCTIPAAQICTYNKACSPRLLLSSQSGDNLVEELLLLCRGGARLKPAGRRICNFVREPLALLGQHLPGPVGEDEFLHLPEPLLRFLGIDRSRKGQREFNRGIRRRLRAIRCCCRGGGCKMGRRQLARHAPHSCDMLCSDGSGC